MAPNNCSHCRREFAETPVVTRIEIARIELASHEMATVEFTLCAACAAKVPLGPEARIGHLAGIHNASIHEPCTPHNPALGPGGLGIGGGLIIGV